MSLAYTEDSVRQNRSAFLRGRPATVAFLTRKSAQELYYRLIKELWTFTDGRLWTRRNPKALLDFVVNLYRAVGFDRNRDAEANAILNPAGIFFAPHMNVQMAVVDKGNGPLTIKVLMKDGSALDGMIGRLIALPLDPKRLDRLQRARFETDAAVILMARFHR